jgi:hypothetical protein
MSHRNRKFRPHKVKPEFKKILGKHKLNEDVEDVTEQNEQPVQIPTPAKVDDDVHSEEEEEDSDEEYVDYVNEEDDIQVDFEIMVPDMDKDYYGLELYAKNYLNGKPYNYVELTELVMGDEASKTPNSLTSVIKVPYEDNNEMKNDTDKKDKNDKRKAKQGVDDDDDDDEGYLANGGGDEVLGWEWNDIYGFLSVIDINKNRKKECIKQIRDYIIENCPDKKINDQLVEVFNGKAALIINERVMNLPFEVGAMLHENLHEEIMETIREGETTFFKHYIIITKIFYPVSTLDTNKKKAKMVPVFYKAEEEYYYNRADIKFKFPIKNPYTYDSNSVALEYAVEHEGVIMVIERNKIEKIVKKIAAVREQMQKQAQQTTTDDKTE